MANVVGARAIIPTVPPEAPFPKMPAWMLTADFEGCMIGVDEDDICLSGGVR